MIHYAKKLACERPGEPSTECPDYVYLERLLKQHCTDDLPAILVSLMPG